jgi:hypothetical protein
VMTWLPISEKRKTLPDNHQGICPQRLERFTTFVCVPSSSIMGVLHPEHEHEHVTTRCCSSSLIAFSRSTAEVFSRMTVHASMSKATAASRARRA